MIELLLPLLLVFFGILALFIIWRFNARKYISAGTVANAYDAWTEDKYLRDCGESTYT
jgi:hypothetical protein